jgi:hypothetical protein
MSTNKAALATVDLEMKGVLMATKKTVQFEAHKNVTKPVKVGFTTKDGPVKFTAKEVVKVPVHVKFKAKKEV